MTYAEKLSMPSWQKRRLQILQRDNWCCQQCGADNIELQVHHKDYIPGIEPWEAPDCDLITLCKKCHSKENKREKHETLLLTSFKNAGITSYEILAISVYIDRYEGFRNKIKSLVHNYINNEL